MGARGAHPGDRGCVRRVAGDYERGRRTADEALRLARERGLFVLYMRGLWTRGLVLPSLGEWDAALRDLEEGVALAEKIGDLAFLPRLMNTLGWLHVECGDVEHGRVLTARALEHARRIRHAFGVEMQAFCLVNMGDSFLVQGDLPLAAEQFDEAGRIAESASTHE
jgi:tetratricopeptide (TPR) repeat protein